MSSTPRVAILISGSGSNLQAFIDEIAEGGYPAQICGVVSDKPSAYGLQRADSAGLPTRVVRRGDYPSRDAFDAGLLQALTALQPDIVVLAGFMRILRGEIVARYAGRLLNIHPALLPKYKGLDTHARCLANGDPVHGSTVHFVTAELDDGPGIIQAQLEVAPEDDVASLQQRVQALEHRIYPMAVRWLAEGRLAFLDGQVVLDEQPLATPVLVTADDLRG
ncbi:MAG: phosphoribosylglycinamide formyltransferase [Pseudomonadota bacterium]